MKRILLTMLLVTTVVFAHSQTTYYWVGGAAPVSIHTVTNWNTALNGSGSPRVSSTGATDVLIFDGTNIGGATPATGLVSGPVDGGMTCAQLKFINNANVRFGRTSGTGTITISGDGNPLEDFVIESGSTLSIFSATGSVRIAMAATNTGIVSGNLSMVTPFQARIDNTTSGTPGSLRFTSGSTMTTNITAASASYAFGNSTQSSQKWVVFEAGSHLYYNGGFSPHGSGTLFSAIDMKPGSAWHHRANNGVASVGNFFNRQSYGEIIVENNATLTAMGSIYQIENLTIDAGSTFIPFASGQTVVTGNLVANGNITLPAGGTNRLVLAGSAAQTVSGSGVISVGSFTIADKTDVTLNKSLAVDVEIDIYGKVNFNTNQLTGNASFYAAGVEPDLAGTGNLIVDRYFITGNTAFGNSSIGRTITGTGIAPNTAIVSFSTTSDSMYISKPLLATASGVSLLATNSGTTLETANTNGFDPATGSVPATGIKNYGDGLNYVINAATTAPLGISTGSVNSRILTGFVDINAAVTVNKSFNVADHLLINGKLTLRPLDTAFIESGAAIAGVFNTSNYIVTDYNTSNGDQGIVMFESLASSTTIPIGSTAYYLPVVLNPSAASMISAAVFLGITTNGTVTGTPLTPAQKQSVVDAVWNINRISGTGNATLQLEWNTALEGSTFTTLPDSDIGLIYNTGSSWALPTGTGNNTLNIVSSDITSYGAFGAGAVPPTIPFIFNPLPVKTYGDPDFNGGATSLNTSQPIIYTSSNPAVATIVAGNIHITGAGTTDITASQASDGFYPPASVTQPLTVNKADLTITADNITKFEGLPNPTLTVTYTGFVLGENAAALLTPVSVTTTATTSSPSGSYPISVSGATSNNYNITFVNGVLTVQPRQTQTITFNALPLKTYGNADFAAGATSTNTTIPITYTSSNTGVATIIGSNIHIVGAGTSTITASQAGNAGFFPAADVSRTLTVNKAALTIRVRDTTRVQGQPNPPFTITYTGFVLGETVTNLTTPAVATTTAVTNSSPGNYPITVGGAASNNYNITNVNGRLTVFPLSGTSQQHLTVFMSNGNTLVVRVFSPVAALGDITVYDMSGKPIRKKNLFMPVGFIQTEIPISTLSMGIYIVAVKGEGVNLTKTISILR